MGDDSILRSEELSTEDIKQQMIHAINFETGMIAVPPDFTEMMKSHNWGAIETLDCMVLSLTTMDNKVHRFTLLIDDVSRVALHFLSWIQELHEGGRCGYKGGHDVNPT